MSFWDSLRGLVEHGPVVWGFFASAAIVLVLTPLTARLAPRIGGVDEGGDRPRVHTRPVPRIGGVAIVLGIMVPALIWSTSTGPTRASFWGPPRSPCSVCSTTSAASSRSPSWRRYAPSR